MTRSRMLLVALLVILLAAFFTLPLAAQPQPVEARGFSPGEVYDYSGLDSVNLFNGNLILALPLGGKSPLGGGFSYGLRLTYNLKIWDIETRTYVNTPVVEAEVSEDFNAGAGWTVSMGGYLTNSNYAENPNGWNLVTEDGAQHHFYQALHISEATGTAFLYTRDGSYLRLRKATREVEYPDGTIRTYGMQEPGVGGKFRLTSIRDRFGSSNLPNQVTVSYGDGANPFWKIEDGLRTHWVHFEAGALGRKRVDRVDLAAFNGSRAIYDFGYQTKVIERSCFDSPASAYPNPADDPTPATATVDFLKTLTLPGTGGTFALEAYNESCAQNGQTNFNLPGTLARLRLPTRGIIDWTYQASDVLTRTPHGGGRSNPGEPPIGSQQVLSVATKTVLNSNGACENHDWPSCTWTYTQGMSAPFMRTVTVREPSGDETVHYFSNDPKLEVGTYEGWEYGLPFDRSQPDGSGLFKSREIYDGPVWQNRKKRTVWVAYEHDKLKPGETLNFSSDWYDSNRRMVAEKTVFHDDSNAWVKTTSSDFDGVGQYRSRVTTASWGPDRATVTTYNPARGRYRINPANNQLQGDHSYTPWPGNVAWILGTSTSQQTTEDGDVVRAETCYDATTGFLRRIRRLAGSSRSANDVISEYTPAFYGSVSEEKHFGGDGGGLPTGVSWCTANLGTPDYRMKHTLQHRLSAKSKFVRPADGGALPAAEGHFTRNLTIDKATGLPKSSADPAGLATAYLYDTLGRLTAERPSSGAWVEYQYTQPTADQLARVNVTQRPYGQTAGFELSSGSFRYESFGRLWREIEDLPGGVTSQQISSYYPNGWLRWKTVAHGDGVPSPPRTQHEGYDPFGRPAKIVPPDGAAHAIDFEYRGIRQTTTTVSVATGVGGAETDVDKIERLDPYGRLIEVLEPSGNGGANVSTRYHYDAANRLERVVTPAAGVTQVRTFDYDGRGFLKTETHPELGVFGNGSTVYSGFDAMGHPRSRRTGPANGPFDLIQEYDALGRLVKLKEARTVGGVQRPLKEFSYGTGQWSGNRSKGKIEIAKRHNWQVNPWNPGGPETDVQVTETYTFGGTGGRPSKRKTDVSTFQRFEQSWTWDDLGNLQHRFYPRCLHGPCVGKDSARQVTSVYTEGRLTAVPGYAKAISYHDNGMLHEIEYPNPSGVTYFQDRDPHRMGRPGSVGIDGHTALAFGDGAFATANLTYQYDGAGNVKAIGTERYRYDKVSRVVEGVLGGGGKQSYSFDPFGNIGLITTVQGGATSHRSYAINPDTNRLNLAGYDAAGNQTGWGSGPTGFSYTWDPMSKMKVNRRGDGSVESYYLYTADDERLNTLDFSVSPVEETWTVRDLDGKVLRTWEAVGGFNGTWTHARDHIYRDGALLASWAPSEDIRHFHLDHLGSPRLITNANGRRVDGGTYFPFGEQADGGNPDEAMRFTGHERDLNGAGELDDLDYMHARYCNPMTARFLSVDPVGGELASPQTWNRFAYVGNNPLNYVDPYGLFRGLTPGEAFPDEISVCENEATGGPCKEDESTTADAEDPQSASSEAYAPDLSGVYNFYSQSQMRGTSPTAVPKALRGMSFRDAVSAAGVGRCDQACQVLGTVAHEFQSDPILATIYGAQEIGLLALTGGAVVETRAAGRAAHRLFRRGGLVNSNRYFRVGFGRKGGERVFRIGGDLLKRTTGKSHIDLWSGGLM